MNMYIFEHVQPNHLYAVMADDFDQAIRAVDRVHKGWRINPKTGRAVKYSVRHDWKIMEVKAGVVYSHDETQPHVMGG